MHSIWAIARNTIKQALRLKIAAVFIILLVILLPVLGLTVTGDGTLKGRLQTFISYGLSLTGFLLCLLTIIVSVYSLTSDIDQKQIYTVVTKPIRRFELLLGKSLGVILLDVMLLGFFSSIIYVITIFTPKFVNPSKAERTCAQNEFFTARVSLNPVEVDVTEEVRDTYKKLEKSGQLQEIFQGLSRKEIITQLINWKKIEQRAAAVGHDLLWEFQDVKPTDPNERIFVRFKYDVSGISAANVPIYGRWFVGDYQYIKYGVESENPVYDKVHSNSTRTFHEIEIPAQVVPRDGHLAVGYLNVPVNNTVVIFSEAPQVLYKADNFTANFLRAVALIFLRLIFLCCLGVLSASFLSFPVAVLLSLVIFFTASFSGFVLESFDYLGKNLSSVYHYAVRPIILLLPQFDKVNPTKFLVPGSLLSWSLLAKVAFFMICIKAAILLLIGLLIFSYREIAKITV